MREPIDLQSLNRPVIAHGTQVGILFGLLLGGMLLAQVLAFLIMLPFLDFGNLDLNNPLNFQDPSTINALKAGQFIATIFSFIVPAWLFCLITRQPLFQFTGFSKNPGWKNAMLVPLLVVFSLPLIAWTAEVNKLLPLPEFLLSLEKDAEELTRVFLKSDGPFDLFINIMVVAVAASISEEVFFRGCLQKAFHGWTKNVHVAVWVTAIFFSAFHLQFHGFIPRMLLGGVMGYLFAWSGSLWVPILAHFINNGLGVAVNYLVQKEVLPATVETYGADPSDWLGIVTGTVMMLVTLLLIKRSNPGILSAGPT